MMEEVHELKKHQHHSKLALYTIVGFLVLLTLAIIIVSNRIQSQQAYQLPSQASEIPSQITSYPPMSPIIRARDSGQLTPLPEASPVERARDNCWGTATITRYTGPGCGPEASIQCFSRSGQGNSQQSCSKIITTRDNKCVSQEDWTKFANWECCSNPQPCSSNYYIPQPASSY